MPTLSVMVDVDTSEFDTEDLIDEMNRRAKQGDALAKRALGGVDAFESRIDAALARARAGRIEPALYELGEAIPAITEITDRLRAALERQAP